MTPLQQKFLRVIQHTYLNSDEESAKASEQICIEEKIELLKDIKKDFRGAFDLYLQDKISTLQNQLNNLK